MKVSYFDTYYKSRLLFQAFEELEILLSKSNICIAVKEKLTKDSGVAEETAYDNVVLRLQTKPRARGTQVFLLHSCIYLKVVLPLVALSSSARTAPLVL